MASPATAKTPAPARALGGLSASAPSGGIEPDRTPAPGTTQGGIVLDAEHQEPAFTYMVHPLRWEARMGHILPVLLKISHEPGCNGNDRTTSGIGAITNYSRLGWQQVPNNFPCTAFGVDRSGEPVTYRNRYTQRHPVSNEIVREHHADCWRRPRIIGSTVHWGDYDAEGELQFRKDLAETLSPGGPDASLVEEALMPLLDSIRAAAARTDGRRLIVLHALMRNLPPEHTPPDIRNLIAAPVDADAKHASA